MMPSTCPARKGPQIMPPRKDRGSSTSRLEVSMAQAMPAARGSTPRVVSRLIRSQWKA